MFPLLTGKVSPHRLQEVIRLSPDPLPMKSAEMTQQQKIAAALSRAGASHSETRGYESTGVAVEAPEFDPAEQDTKPVRELHSAQFTPTPRSVGINHLLMWFGLALAVLSCYLLVTFH